MLGHARPVFLRFGKGGKMVATAGGATLALAPLAAVICVAVWLVVFVATRYASVASLVTALALAVLVLVLGYPWPIVAFGIAAAAAVVVLHRQNIRRLVGGTEHRFERCQRALYWRSRARRRASSGSRWAGRSRARHAARRRFRSARPPRRARGSSRS